MSRRALPALAALAIAFAGVANAGPREDLHAAFSKFLAQTSFRGDIDGNMAGRSSHSRIEFQAPDRVRVTTEGRPPVIMIGGTMYMTANGRAMKVPMTGGNPMAQYRDPAMLAHGVGGCRHVRPFLLQARALLLQRAKLSACLEPRLVRVEQRA